MQATPQQSSAGSAWRAVQHQDSVWTGATCAQWTGRASRVWMRTWSPLGTTRHHASERAGAGELPGPEDLSPVVL